MMSAAFHIFVHLLPRARFSFFNVMNSLFEVSIIRSLSSLELIFCLPSLSVFTHRHSTTQQHPLSLSRRRYAIEKSHHRQGEKQRE